jgi:serine/threonine-protein kinase RsbW
MSVTLDLALVRAVRRDLRLWLDEVGITGDACNDILLATHEAVANAIEHAERASEVAVTGARKDDKVVVIVINRGEWTKRGAPDDERGRGLAMIGALMSNFEIDSRHGRTVVRMSKDVEPVRKAAH